MVQRIVQGLAVAMIVWVGSLSAQAPAPPLRQALDSATYAWEGGRYPEALERFERLLKGPDRDSVLAPIALMTGELYRTREIAPDASNLRWSADGAMLAYDIGEDSVRRSVLVRLDDSGAIRPDTLPGYAAAFAPDGSEVAYIRAGGATAVRRPTSGGAEQVLRDARPRRPRAGVRCGQRPALPGGHRRSLQADGRAVRAGRHRGETTAGWRQGDRSPPSRRGRPAGLRHGRGRRHRPCTERHDHRPSRARSDGERRRQQPRIREPRGR